MVDLILLVFFLAVFYAGFYCGKKYTGIGAMFKEWWRKAKSLGD